MGNPKQKWTSEEEEALRAGVKKHGTGKWKDIQKDPEFNPFLSSRSNIDLKVSISLSLLIYIRIRMYLYLCVYIHVFAWKTRNLSLLCFVVVVFKTIKKVAIGCKSDEFCLF